MCAHRMNNCMYMKMWFLSVGVVMNLKPLKCSSKNWVLKMNCALIAFILFLVVDWVMSVHFNFRPFSIFRVSFCLLSFSALIVATKSSWDLEFMIRLIAQLLIIFKNKPTFPSFGPGVKISFTMSL